MTDEVICGVTENRCICVLAVGHDEVKDAEHAHTCECEGSWWYDEAGEFHVNAWPGIVRGKVIPRGWVTEEMRTSFGSTYVPYVKAPRGRVVYDKSGFTWPTPE